MSVFGLTYSIQDILNMSDIYGYFIYYYIKINNLSLGRLFYIIIIIIIC